MSSFDARFPAAEESQPADRRLRAQIAWGGGGFLLGAIVWHFIGFWSFVTTVVFRGPDSIASPSVASAAGPRATAPSSKRSETVLGATPIHAATSTSAAPMAACSELALDRAAGTTSLVTCAEHLAPMRVVQPSVRGDRFVIDPSIPEDWSVLVDARLDAATMNPRLDTDIDRRAVQLD